jgi:hypothetical protein
MAERGVYLSSQAIRNLESVNAFSVRRVLSNAEVVALDGAPIVLVPGKAGIWYSVIAFGVSKAAGAYTVVATTDWQINLGSTAYLTMDGEAGFMTNASAAKRYRTGPSVSIAGTDPTNYLDGAISVTVTAGGGFSDAGGGACTVYIAYVALPY